MNRYLTANGLNLGALLGFRLIMGFGGAIISLLISKPVAKWSSGVRVIDGSGSPDERWIVDTVRKFADQAGIGMPEVGIFEGDPNAFATGPSRTTPWWPCPQAWLQGMTREEIEAVIGHGGPHRQRRHGDHDADPGCDEHLRGVPVARHWLRGGQLPAQERRGKLGPRHRLHVTTIVLDIVLGFLAAIIVAWFSRQREFRADAGAAQLMGRRQPMINALARLGGMHPGELPKERGRHGHCRWHWQAVQHPPAH